MVSNICAKIAILILTDATATRALWQNELKTDKLLMIFLWQSEQRSACCNCFFKSGKVPSFYFYKIPCLSLK